MENESFDSFFDAIYWATVSLTTVGYGDVYPITAVGRLFASIISIVGIGIIAIPTGIIAAGFTSVINKEHEAADKEDPKLYCPYCGHKLE